MALRRIRLDSDPLLRKKSREVEEINSNIKTLVEDMYETMYDAEGVGLAAPQVGVLKRVVVVDTREEGEKLTLINPKILEFEGNELGMEGCLSVPGYQGEVERPINLKLEFMDIDGNIQEIETEGFLSRAICHELDHLDGILYTDKAKNMYIIEENEDEDEEV